MNRKKPSATNRAATVSRRTAGKKTEAARTPKPSQAADLAPTAGPELTAGTPVQMPEHLPDDVVASPAKVGAMVPEVSVDEAGTTPDAPQAESTGTPDVTVAVEPVPVIIEVDPSLTGGMIQDRFDVTVRGRIVSPATIESASLLVDGELAAGTLYGVQDSEIVHAVVDGMDMQQRMFRFTLSRRRDAARGQCTFMIVARTVDGQIQEQSFTLQIDPASKPPVQVTAGPLQPDLGETPAVAPAALYVERAAINEDGVLIVDGWGLARSPVVVIQAFVGESRVSTAKLGIEREDVAAAYPSYPNGRRSGYSVSGRVHGDDIDAPTVRVEMLCRQGLSQEVVLPLQRVQGPHRTLGEIAATQAASEPVGSPVTPETFAGYQPLNLGSPYNLSAAFQLNTEALLAPLAPPPPAPVQAEVNREIRLFCDEAALTQDGYVHISGWAVCAAGLSRVAILLDDREVGLAEFGHERPDVGNQYADIPSARFSGFRFHRKVLDTAEGLHGLTVIAYNLHGEEREETAMVFAEGFDDVTVPPPVAVPEPEPEQPPAPAAAAPPEAFRFQLDNPTLVNGAVVEPITGRLTLEGWVLARDGVETVEVAIDGQRLGEAHYGMARQDVGAAYPDWENSVRSGYAFHCPPRSMREGEQTVEVTVRNKTGQEYVHRFRIDVRKSDEQRQGEDIRRRVSRVEADFVDDLLTTLNHRPEFVVLLRQNGPLDEEKLALTLASLRTQAYGAWRLRALCDSTGAADAMRALIDAQGRWLSLRSSVLSPDDVGWDELLAERPDLLFMPLCPGDELGADALGELALRTGLHPEAELVYADEARISPVSEEVEAFLKPGFSPDLLLSTNYIGRPWAARGALIARTDVSPGMLAIDGEYDLVLRCTELAASIQHVPKLLCRRGDMKLDDDVSSLAALSRAAVRRGFGADLSATPISGTWRLRRHGRATGKVSIIIPTCAAHGYIETCITTLRNHTAYKNYEIICIDNIPDTEPVWKAWLKDNADKIVDIPDAFNWSRFNNLASEVADGEFILFLNDDIEIERPDWLDALLEHAVRPEVGIVGARLLYPDRKVQHGGMFLMHNGIARHSFRFAAEDDPGYFGLALTQRNVIAVTGACMLMRRDVFEGLGRFDEAHEVVNNDLDLCLRSHRAGLLTVITPYSTLVHHELASRDRLKDVYDLTHFNARWKTLFDAGDPYYNPRQSKHSDDYRPDDEPVEIVHPGQPLYLAEDIRNILVVKLDHIGDFITGIAAIRRLREMFPAARIAVLAGRAVQAFAAYEPAIDEFIEFEFFHARSGLGRKELTEDDYKALQAQLRPYDFDLAIDLRKQTDTRDVLKWTGARFLAGFDHMGQFTYLDIAVVWEGDQNLHRKRSHVSDDLMLLVDAVADAGRMHRTSLILPPEAPATAVANLPEEARALFEKPVVAIHPGVGTIMRQWPAEHFAGLIDLLVERHGVNAVLIGGPDEAELADEVISRVLHAGSVMSLIGKTPLRDLPGLLASCKLYVGNNSGPKHIAAALGVPTIGIHSGVVDAIEWGPVGARAIALRRNMACSPCYLARFEDCPRSLACLRGLEPVAAYEAAEAMLARPIVPLPLEELQPVDWRARVVAAQAAAALQAKQSAAEAAPAKGRKRGRKQAAVADAALAGMAAAAADDAATIAGDSLDRDAAAWADPAKPPVAATGASALSDAEGQDADGQGEAAADEAAAGIATPSEILVSEALGSEDGQDSESPADDTKEAASLTADAAAADIGSGAGTDTGPDPVPDAGTDSDGNADRNADADDTVRTPTRRTRRRRASKVDA
ncbi:MAG: glycosyltransferase family 9 protein [Acetobacteraceae bacterium]